MATIEERLDGLEKQCDILRSALAAISNQLPLQAEQLRQVSRSCAILDERTEKLAAAEAGHTESLSKVEAGLSDIVSRTGDQNEELVKLRTALSRLQRQLDLNADEARRTGTALLEMIEQNLAASRAGR